MRQPLTRRRKAEGRGLICLGWNSADMDLEQYQDRFPVSVCQRCVLIILSSEIRCHHFDDMGIAPTFFLTHTPCMSSPEFISVADIASLPPGSGRTVHVKGRDLAVY